jgi:hypothetical protein
VPATNGTRGILDTSTVILLPRLSDPTLLPAEPLITAVTLAELSVGPLVARSPGFGHRVKHLWLHHRILVLDPAAADDGIACHQAAARS